MADLYDFCGQRHGSGSLHPLEILGVAGAALMIDGVAGAHISANYEKIHRIFAECFFVKGIQLFRHGVVAELFAVKIAGAQQVAEAGIPPITAVFGIVTDDAPDLVRLVIAAKHRTRRDADGSVQPDLMLHQHIQNTCGEHPAHGTAFHHKSCFHKDLLFRKTGVRNPVRTSILSSVYTKSQKVQEPKNPNLSRTCRKFQHF